MDTPENIFAEYLIKERSVTPQFINQIPWDNVKDTTISLRYQLVIRYMRDVEYLTNLYHDELLHSPSSKQPIIANFMSIWQQEEARHSALLERFLDELSPQSEIDWQKKVTNNIPYSYRLSNKFIIPQINKLIGDNFPALHMTWGAINEFSTLQGYRCLSQLVEHPILKQILSAIIHEEAIHAWFYFSMAKYLLSQSTKTQRIVRTVIDWFWTPVGEGVKPKKESNYVIATLFGNEEGMHWFDKGVTNKLRKLPGFTDCETPTKKIRKALD